MKNESFTKSKIKLLNFNSGLIPNLPVLTLPVGDYNTGRKNPERFSENPARGIMKKAA